MIKLKDVSKIYYNNGAVGTGFSNISTEFKIGEFVVIVGESGSGKSTLLNVISGLDTYEEGEMYINGEETSHYAEQEFEDYRRKYIANIFQSFNLVNSYTVRQNVELVLLINGYSKSEMKSRVDDILKNVGLWELRNKRITKLSGGQKQRVAIARALAKETPIIIADEPTGNLDSESAKQIFELLHEMSKDKLVIIVTHNLEQVSMYATRIIRMHDGHIIEDKRIKKVTEVKPELSHHNEMTFASKFFLSIRNSLNIPLRFLIILGVFLAVCITILGEFASVNMQDYTDILNSASEIFFDKSPERIIVTKDKKALTDEEISELESLPNVSKLVRNDYLLDQRMYILAELTYTITEEGSFDIIDNFDGELKEGVKPNKPGEVLMVLNEEAVDTVFKDYWFNKSAKLESSGNRAFEFNGKVVGYAYDNSLSSYTNKYYVTKETYDMMQAYYLLYYAKTNIKYGDNETLNLTNDFIEFDSSIPKGTIYVGKTFGEQCNDKCLGQNMTVHVDTFYESIDKKFNIISKDDLPYYFVRFNPNDVLEFSTEANYQVSLFVDKLDNVDTVLNLLNEKGYKSFAVKDTVSATDPIIRLYDFISYLGIGFIIFALFFVSYFIISLVLKSKTTYFAIVRILGGNVKLNKKLINLELFNIMNIAFIFTLVICLLNYYGVIYMEDLSTSVRFIKPMNYIILYIVMFIFSQLLAHKYSKKIFKNSMITTYNGEI